MKTTRRLAALVAGMMTLAGCGRELVGGGQRNVDAVATGDGTSGGGGSASMAPSFASAPAGPVFQANGFAGTITFDARVSLVRGGTADPLGTGTATVLVNGGDTVAVVSGRASRVEYPVARVVFTRVTANVTGGLVIGGAAVTGQVNVAIAPGDSIVVERPVNLGDADDDATLLIDLDASAWLALANPVTRIVPAAGFQSAVKLRRAD